MRPRPRGRWPAAPAIGPSVGPTGVWDNDGVTPPASADLPPHWSARAPSSQDVAALTALVAHHHLVTRGSTSVDEAAVALEVTGYASWTRRQLLVTDPQGAVRGWCRVHDRAAGRTVVDLTVDPGHPDADQVAAHLFAWAQEMALVIAGQRGLPGTQLDSGRHVDDESQARWLAAAGYTRVRTWLQMTRPVMADEGAPGALPGPREGVTVRRVATHDTGLPVAGDLQTVHQMLEESFADHFNSYRESFPEFVQRLREDPGHRWDHWGVAEVESDGATLPGGAIVSSVLSADATGTEGSYVDYIGVHRRARGRGVAKALLHTVIRDAAQRGRNRVNLEVDADSPTGADGLYVSMGWHTAYRTESWHRDVQLPH